MGAQATISERELAAGAPSGSTGARTAIPPAAIVGALALLGGLLRLLTLDVQSLNVDEADTVLLLHRSFTGMLSHLHVTESSPPLYYVLAWLWSRVFGMGAVGIRSFSAVVGTLTIPAMYLAGRRTSVRAGLWAAAFAACSSAMFYFSQEARCYPLLILWLALAYRWWRGALDDGDARSKWMWAMLSILALLTHYFTLFILIPQVVLFARRRGVRATVAPVGAIALVGLALVPLAASQRSDGKTNWIEELSLGGRVAEATKVLTVGKYTFLVLPAVCVVLGLLAWAVWLLARHGEESERRAGLDAGIVAAVALGLPLVLAIAHVIDIFDGTNVSAAWIPLTLLMAYGVGTRGAGRAGVAVGSIFCALSLALIVTTNLMPAYARDDWKGVVRALGTGASGRAVVIRALNRDGVEVYLGPVRTVSGTTVKTSEIDFVSLRNRRTVGAPSPPVVPVQAPAGMQPAGVTRTSTFAISRFRAARPVELPVSALRALKGESNAEVVVQP